MSARITRVTATGDVTTDDAHLLGVCLLGGSAASTLTVRRGGSGGTVVLTLKAAIDTVVSVPDLHEAYCADGIHATLAGADAEATFVYA